jgi:hypothetical protein
MSRVARLAWIGSLALAASWPSTSRADTNRGGHAALSPWRKLSLTPSVAASLASLTAFLAGPQLFSARASALWPIRPRYELSMRPPAAPLGHPGGASLRAPLVVVPELVTPSLTSGRGSGGPLALGLRFRTDPVRETTAEPRSFVMPRLDDAVPPLLRYSSDEANVSVSIAPGGPCTAACLKVAGSF